MIHWLVYANVIIHLSVGEKLSILSWSIHLHFGK